MKSGVAFDLDGVLIDYTYRYHRVYHDILAEFDLPCPSREELIALRKSLRTSQLLEKIIPSNAQKRVRIIAACIQKRNKLFESERYLTEDRFFEGFPKIISLLRQRQVPTALITRRIDEQLTLQQLGDHQTLFNMVAVTKEKGAALKNFVTSFQIEQPYFITDSCDDIREGKKAGVITICLLTGLENEEMITEAAPDYILPSLKSAHSFLFEHAKNIEYANNGNT